MKHLESLIVNYDYSVRDSDAMVDRIQKELFRLLQQTNTKVPQTEEGMAQLKTGVTKILKKFVDNGVIGTGLSWTSSSNIGNTESLKQNIKDNGFYVYSSPITNQSEADRTARKAPTIQIAVKMAGAIHFITSILIKEN